MNSQQNDQDYKEFAVDKLEVTSDEKKLRPAIILLDKLRPAIKFLNKDSTYKVEEFAVDKLEVTSDEKKLRPAIILLDKLRPAIEFLNKDRTYKVEDDKDIKNPETLIMLPPPTYAEQVRQELIAQKALHYKFKSPAIPCTTSQYPTKNNEIVRADQTDQTFIKAKSKAIAPTPYLIAQELRRKVSFVILREGLYFFDGIIYRLLTKDATNRLIMKHCREYAKETGDAKIIKSIREMVMTEPEIEIVNETDLDGIVVFQNGYLNLRTYEFRQPSPAIFTTSCLNVVFTPNEITACPNFDRFIYQIAGGDDELIERIYEVIGLYLTNDMRAKKFVIFQGVPDSGKSVLGRVLQGFYSEDATTSVDIYSLKNQFAMSELVGKRINLSMDLPAGLLSPPAISAIKQLTGGDLQSADVKYSPRIKFLNTCKLLYSTNHAIELEHYDEAFFDRVVVVPFNYRIPREQQNRDLRKLFEQERLAIALKALYHYKKLVARNYKFSGDFQLNGNISFSNITEPSKDEFVKEFVLRRCEFTDCGYGTLTRDLYREYGFFVDERSRFDIGGFSTSLHRQFKEKVIKAKWRDGSVSGNPENGYKGIILKGEVQ